MKKRQNLIRTIAGLMTVMLMLDQTPVMKAFAVSDTDVTEAVSDETEIDEDSEIALDDENDDPESGDSEGELDDNSEDENESNDEECVNDNDETDPEEEETVENSPEEDEETEYPVDEKDETEKIEIYKTEVSADWYRDYEYTLNSEGEEEGNTITLTSYIGTDTELYVPAVAIIDNVEYSTFLSGAVYESQKKIKSISFENGVALSSDVSFMFDSCEALENIDLSGVDSSRTTSMDWMFSTTISLESITLDGLDVSNVTSMNGMFLGCGNRTYWDANAASNTETFSWSGLQAPNAKNADYMFENCGFQNIILEDASLPNASIDSMFRDCTARKIDIENADFGNVTSYRRMFADCKNLVSINMKGVTSHNVTNMEYMFSECDSLKKLDISGLTVENVNKFEKMFYNCKSLPTLDLSNFDFGKRWSLTSSSGIKTMLEGTNPEVILTPVGLTNLNYIPLESTYVDDDGIYWRALPAAVILTESDGGHTYDPESLTLYRYTEELQDTSSLLDDFMVGYSTDNAYINGYNGTDESIVIPSVVVKDGKPYNVVLREPYTHEDDTSNYASNWGKTVKSISFERGVRVFGYLSFRECENLEQIDFTGLDGEHLLSMYDMFLYCANLKEVDFGDLYTGNVTNMSNVFSGCEALEQIDISMLDTHSVEDYGLMFHGCTNLKTLDMKGIDTTNATVFNGMFWDCPKLETIDISGFESDKVQVVHSMFADCENVRSIDMSGLDLANLIPRYHEQYDLTFFGCKSLNIIRTPKNLTCGLSLNGTFVDRNTNTEYTELPKNLPYSITLVRKGVEYNGVIQAANEIQEKGIDQVVGDLKKEGSGNIETDLEADGAKDAYATIDSTYAEKHEITVSISSEVNEIDDGSCAVKGAALNLGSGYVNIIIENVPNGEYVNDGYEEVNFFEMRAEASESDGTEVDFSKNLEVPLVITLPIPEGMETDGIKILHYGSGESVEVITPDTDVKNRMVTLTHLSVFAFAQGEIYILGDINGDNKVNAADRIYLARYLAGWSGYTLGNDTVADVNKDNTVDTADRVYLARYLAGWSGYEL